MLWDYMQLRKRTTAIHELDNELRNLGVLGWEVCGFASADKTIGLNESVVLLKRERLGLPPPAETAIPEWYPDPSGRFELRYWDGLRWTDHVSADGKTSTDWPLP
jgi:hypothetical protein